MWHANFIYFIFLTKGAALTGAEPHELQQVMEETNVSDILIFLISFDLGEERA